MGAAVGARATSRGSSRVRGRAWSPQPAAGSCIGPLTPLTLTFARPVASVLGSRLPTLEPAMPGHWEQVDTNTLTFQPAGLGFGLGGTVQVRVPGRVARLAREPRARRCACRSCSRVSAISPCAGARPTAPPSTPGCRGGRRRARAARHLLVALSADARFASDAVETGQLERRHPGRRDALRERARHGHRRRRRPAGLAGSDPRRPRRPALRRGLQLRLRARDDPAIAQPLARRPRHPHLARQHRHRVGADRAGDVARLRAHLGRDDERDESRRLALQRSRDPLDQLLPRRRRTARVPARVVRDAAEPRLRRAAGGGGGRGLALHARSGRS